MTITVPRTRKFYIRLAKIPGIGPHVKWATHRGKEFHLLSTCDPGGSSNLVRSSLGAGHPLERGGRPAAGWRSWPASAPPRRSLPPRPLARAHPVCIEIAVLHVSAPVTSGGPFDPATGQYLDNIVVCAHLASRVR